MLEQRSRDHAAPEPGARSFVSSAFESASAMDLACTRFALRSILTLGARFNLRRDVNNVVTLAARYCFWPEPIFSRLRDFLSRRCADSPAWADCGKLTLDEFMVRHGAWNGLYDDSTFYYFIDEYVKLHGKDLLSVFQSTLAVLDQRLAKTRIRLLDNIAMLSAVLGLTDAEQAVLLHASLCKYQRDLRPVLVDCKASSAQEAYAMLGQVLGFTAQDVSTALKPGSRLESLGLIETPIAEHSVTDLGDLMRVSDKLLAVLTAEYPSESSMMAAFTRPASPTQLTDSDFPHVGEDTRYLVALLRAAVDGQERGVNVLLYGPPGTGKTEFAKLLAQQAGLELYEVDCLDKEGNSLSGKERYRSLQVSQAFLKGRARAALLFDEVEDVFPPVASEVASLFGGEETRGAAVNGKAWVNQTLENNPVPTLWISNSIGQIDPAYRRRFQFHLELETPPQKVRETIARKVLGELGVSEAFVSRIAARPSITPAQIQAAARFARLARSRLDESAESLIERQLARADKALGNDQAQGDLRVEVTRYDLSLLNVESRHAVPRIVEALKMRPRATMCFYGLPGSGKTALGEHIARSIDKPLMIRRASDLMSKYVGETEQQMAKMFAQAQRESAVLLLDEADSFLQNRQMAVRSYEVTEVNEMLQGMERFDGIFICTTNLFERLDEAALRRFSFKIRFLPLLPEQRLRMFVSEVLEGDETRLTDGHRDALSRLELLAPGDFAAVKRQYQLLGDVPAPEEFIEQLGREHAVKPDVRHARPMGFVR
ncbi:MAG: AAA family ATPase [Burkholderiaceae bacterium]|nr:AAA family ATPase [Burkholderiaceae bacterium]